MVTVFSCIRISCPTEIEYVMSNGPLVGFVAIVQKCIIFQTGVLGVSLPENITVVEKSIKKSHLLTLRAKRSTLKIPIMVILARFFFLKN